MSIRKLLFFTLSLYFIISCKKKDDEASPVKSVTNCRISKIDISSIDLQKNDTIKGYRWEFSYNSASKVTSILETEPSGKTKRDLFEYNSKGTMTSHTGMAGIESYHYNNEGKLIYTILDKGTIYGKDSIVNEYVNSTLRLETNHSFPGTNGIKPSSYKRKLEFDNSGNLIKIYSNYMTKDSFLLWDEYEYYSDIAPVSFDGYYNHDPLFVPKNLLKKHTSFIYGVSEGTTVISTSIGYDEFSYERDAKGNIQKQILIRGDDKNGDIYKTIFSYTYDCF